MKNTAIIGLQWGDEGKGKIVDFLADKFDAVVRFQGGNNAGHTIKVDGKTFKLSLLPSGVIRQKFSVIGSGVVVDPISLFDEIEKAHPDIFNTLLQILDEGTITDGLGRKINFKNCLIILTSNVGQRKAAEFGGGVGFGAQKENVREKETRNTIRKELEKMFPPEFINRLDEIIYFNSLTPEDLIKIIDVEIKKMTPRFEEIGYKLTITKDLKEKIAEGGYDPKFGARPLRRLLQKYVEDTIAELVVTRKVEIGAKITLSFDPKKDPEFEPPVKVKIVNPKSEE